MNNEKTNIDWSGLPPLPNAVGFPVRLEVEDGGALSLRYCGDCMPLARRGPHDSSWKLKRTQVADAIDELWARNVIACIDAINTYAREHSYKVASGREVLAGLLVGKETIRIRDAGSKGPFVTCQLNSDVAAAAMDGFVVRLGDTGAQALGKFALGTYEVQLESMSK